MNMTSYLQKNKTLISLITNIISNMYIVSIFTSCSIKEKIQYQLLKRILYLQIDRTRILNLEEQSFNYVRLQMVNNLLYFNELPANLLYDFVKK